MKTLTRSLLLCGALLGSSAAFAAQILAAPNGMTLYVFAKDQNGVSSCYDACAAKWPPFTGTENERMPEGWSLAPRIDGTMQWTYEGKPTYFYVEDTKMGDMKGDNYGGVWSVIRN